MEAQEIFIVFYQHLANVDAIRTCLLVRRSRREALKKESAESSSSSTTAYTVENVPLLTCITKENLAIS